METFVRKKPFVDIILPNYNKGKFLEEAINSVISQTYKKDFTIGSTVKLFWEGRAENTESLKVIKGAFDMLSDLYKVQLHIVTDLSYYSVFDLYFPKPKISQYWTSIGNHDLWCYLAGEYGGGNSGKMMFFFIQ